MSVTFNLPNNETCCPACPTCGGRINWEPKPDPSCEDPSCEGYGPDPVEAVPSLNVANGNAYVILTGLLGIDSGAELYGELNPHSVLVELCFFETRVNNLIREPEEEGNVIRCGLPRTQLERYATELTRLATIAARRKVMITYG